MKRGVEYINVLGQVYSITLEDLSGSGHDGECDHDIKTITIGDHLSEARMKNVMLHELMHAFMYESGMSEYIEHQAEEMICQSLSNFLNGLLNWTIKAQGNKKHLNS